MKPALPLPVVPAGLNGLRVMVLEDDPFCAILLEDMLVDLGFSVVGPFGELDQATDFIAAHADCIDVAILDVDIHGEDSFGLAELLVQRNVPFFFATGYSAARMPLRWRIWPNIGKLFTETRLLAMIAESYGLSADSPAEKSRTTQAYAAK